MLQKRRPAVVLSELFFEVELLSNIMVYVVIFMIFYSLDIFISCRFDSFGGIGVSNLNAAVATYTIYTLIKARRGVIFKRHARIVNAWIFWLFYLTLIYLLDWVACIISPDSWFSQARRKYYLNNLIFDYVLIGITLLLVAFSRFPRQCPWIAWLSFSGISVILKLLFMLALFFIYGSIPVMIWRFSGLFDLPMLFCMLMAVHSLIRAQAYEFG